MPKSDYRPAESTGLAAAAVLNTLNEAVISILNAAQACKSRIPLADSQKCHPRCTNCPVLDSCSSRQVMDL